MAAGKSYLGLDRNVTNLISWLLPFMGLIAIFAEKEDKNVKYHGWQSTAWAVVWFVGSTVLSVISAGLLGCITPFLFIINIIAAIKVYKNEDFRLPVLADFAETQSNK